MPSSPFFSGRIPQDLYDAIEKHRKDSGESKTDVLVKALSVYINHPVSWPPLSGFQLDQSNPRLEAIEREIQDLNSKIVRVYKYMASISAQNTAPVVNDIPDGQMVLEGITAVNGDNSFDNKPDNKAKGKKDKPVITSDNTFDNRGDKSDNTFDNKKDNRKVESENQKAEQLSPDDGILVGTLRTVEIPALEGLEKEDSKKIKTKLNNTKNNSSQRTRIGQYLCVFAGRTQLPGKNGKLEMLWDVYKLEESKKARLEEASDIPLEELEGYQESHSQADS